MDTTKTNQLFLLDAYALIFRAYYAFIRSPRIDSQGRDLSAVFGFALTLIDILQRENPDYIAVVFDPPGGTFRHREYPDYKAQREETPEGIRLAVPYIKRLLEVYRIPIVEVADYEADDVIGTLAQQAQAQGLEVLMVTPDKDYGQLVTSHTKMYRPASGGGFELWGEAEVCAKFGLQSTRQIVDYLGLVGDTADNLPGCKGIGEKTASKLLGVYPTLEEIYAHLSDIGGATARKLEEGRELVELTRRLATIALDAPIQFSAEEYRRVSMDVEGVRALFTELEFRSLLSRVAEMEAAPILVPESRVKSKKLVTGELFQTSDLFFETEISEPVHAQRLEYPIHLLDSASKIQTFVEAVRQAGYLCLDTETTSKDALVAELVAITFAINPDEAYFLSIPADRRVAEALLLGLKPVLEDTTITKIGQNIKYDLEVLQSYGIDLGEALFDTMVAHYLLAPDMRHGLDEMSEHYLGHRPMSFEEMLGEQSKDKFDLRQVDTERLAYYATEDALVTYRLYELFAPKLTERGLDKLFHEVEMPLIPVLAEMERTGVRIEVGELERQSLLLGQRLSEIEQGIYLLAGHSFNINSSRQVAEVLFDELQIVEKVKKTKGGVASTSVDVLEKLRERHPIVGEILSYRALKKLLSTYIDSLPEMLYSDGRLHSSFNQTVAGTGRLSSSNPNLQNIPIRTEEGRGIRAAFVADEGDCVFLSADYSQIELRLMAHMSEDKALIEAFLEGEDIHRATAAQIYRVPIEAVTAEQRRAAKAANFGIIYGGSAFGMSERLGISRGEAKDIITGYFDSYPGVARYMESLKEEARRRGYVSTLLGRRSYLRDINSANATVRQHAERTAINAPLQGTAADIIKLAMIHIHREIKRRGLKSRLLLQVHDELNFNVPREELEEMSSMVREQMMGVVKDLRVPLLVEVGVGTNWLEAH